MAEQLYPHALTTLARIKQRLGITISTQDALFTRLINTATDIIESGTNRKFLEQVYTNELYSVYHDREEFILLKQMPVKEITSFKFRAGFKSTPNWTDFPIDSWELCEDGASGLVRMYFYPSKGTNILQITYKAGYKFDFANAGDPTKHELPADLTELCERIISRIFQGREHQGKKQESFNGGSITWQEDLPQEDKDIINGYKKLPVFI